MKRYIDNRFSRNRLAASQRTDTTPIPLYYFTSLYIGIIQPPNLSSQSVCFARSRVYRVFFHRSPAGYSDKSYTVQCVETFVNRVNLLAFFILPYFRASLFSFELKTLRAHVWSLRELKSMYFFNLLHLCRKKKSTLKEAQVVRISSHFEELESSDSKAAGKIFQGE